MADSEIRSSSPLTRADALIAVALFLVTAALYARTYTFDFTNYDDDLYVSQNEQVESGLTFTSIKWAFTSSTAANWHPLTMLSHLLDVELFGVKPGPMHLVNAGVHAINAALCFVALFMLTGARWPAAICAAAFAFHPQRVESVAWISERKDVLSGLFFFLTLIFYVRYARTVSIKRYLIVLAMLALGLMAKPMLVTLPPLLLLLDFWPLRRLSRRAVLEKLPMLALVAAASVVTYLVQKDSRAVSGFASLPMSARLPNALHSVLVYITQFFWPSNLAPFYLHPYLPPISEISKIALISAGAFALTMTIAALLLIRRAPWIFVGWFWYLGMLIPVIGIVQVGRQSHADRYTYLPMIGFTMAIVWTIAAAMRQTPPPGVPRGGVTITFILILFAAMIFATHRQMSPWRNSRTLWEHALHVGRDNSVARVNLGEALTAAGDEDGAIAQYKRGAEIDETSAMNRRNLAVIYIARGDDKTAKPLLRRALQLDPTDIETFSTLAGIYVRENRLDDALLLYRQAIKRDPKYADGFYNIGVTLAQQGKYAEAIESLKRVLELRPEDAAAQRALTAAESANRK